MKTIRKITNLLNISELIPLLWLLSLSKYWSRGLGGEALMSSRTSDTEWSEGIGSSRASDTEKMRNLVMTLVLGMCMLWNVAWGQVKKKVREPWTKQIHAGLSAGYVLIPKEIDYAILGQRCWGAETGFSMGKKWWRLGTTLKYNNFYFKTLADLKDINQAPGTYGSYFFKGNTQYNSNAFLLSQFIRIVFLRKFKIHPFIQTDLTWAYFVRFFDEKPSAVFFPLLPISLSTYNLIPEIGAEWKVNKFNCIVSIQPQQYVDAPLMHSWLLNFNCKIAYEI